MKFKSEQIKRPIKTHTDCAELNISSKIKKEPKVIYEFIETGDMENRLNMAFAILFEEVMKRQKSG